MQLNKVDRPRCRDIFPGEVTLDLLPAFHAELQPEPAPYALNVNVLWFDADNVPDFTKLTSGSYRLYAFEGEPFILELKDCPVTAHTITANHPYLVELVGNELALEIEQYMLALLRDWKNAKVTQDRINERFSTFLRFANMVDYNQLYLRLCEYIAKQTHGVFDARQRLAELLAFWNEEASPGSGHMYMYDARGPVEGQTKDEHRAEAAAFKQLVAAGLTATSAQLALVSDGT